MGIIAESPVWEPTIYSLETTDPVEGGITGISNRSRWELANRTAQIREVLKKHGIEVNPADNIGFTGQWVDPAPTFEGSVVDSDVVYYNIGNAQYEKALADASSKRHFVGVADVTNGKVIAGGFLGNPVISGAPAQGDLIYLSDTTPGQMTTTPTPVSVGKFLFTATMILNAGVGGAGGSGDYQHEQDSYRMLLDSSYYKNGFYDALLDEAFITHNMTFDYGSNRLDFTVGEQMTTGNLKDPLVSLVIDEAFLSVDIEDSGATTFEMSADGGSNWETVSNNAVHLFANTGSDLRVRITGGGTGKIRSYGVMYNVEQQIKGTISLKHSELTDDEPEKHRLINDAGTGATELWSANKIDSELATVVGLIPSGGGVGVGDQPFSQQIYYANEYGPYTGTGTLWTQLRIVGGFGVDRNVQADHYHQAADPNWLILEGEIYGFTEGIRLVFGGSQDQYTGTTVGWNPFTLSINAGAIGLGWKEMHLEYRASGSNQLRLRKLRCYWNSVNGTL